MTDILQTKIIGRLIRGDRDFAGHCVTLTGCDFVTTKLLAYLLLHMDFTVTCVNEGSPSVTFTK